MTYQEYKAKREALDVEFVTSKLKSLDVKPGDIFHIKKPNVFGNPNYGSYEMDVVACDFIVYSNSDETGIIRCSKYDKDDLVTLNYSILGEKIPDSIKCCHILNTKNDKKIGHIDLPPNLVKVTIEKNKHLC